MQTRTCNLEMYMILHCKFLFFTKKHIYIGFLISCRKCYNFIPLFLSSFPPSSLSPVRPNLSNFPVVSANLILSWLASSKSFFLPHVHREKINRNLLQRYCFREQIRLMFYEKYGNHFCSYFNVHFNCYKVCIVLN